MSDLFDHALREKYKNRKAHTKKNNKTYSGYKRHTILDDNSPVPTIRSYAITTAMDNDTSIDLSKHGITVYRDILAMIPANSTETWTGV